MVGIMGGWRDMMVDGRDGTGVSDILYEGNVAVRPWLYRRGRAGRCPITILRR
jgi:hypothetical protein